MRRLGAVLAALVALSVASAVEARDVLDRVAAVVNDEIILLSEVERAAERSPAMVEIMGKLPPGASEDQKRRALEQVHAKELDNLIDNKLIQGEAERFQITATEEDVTRMLPNVASGYGLSVEELRAEVEQSDEYASWDEYKDELRRDILIYKTTNALATWSVSDAQIREHYRKMTRDESAKVDVERFVFSPTGQGSEARDQAFVRAQKVARKLRAGVEAKKIATEINYDLELDQSIGRGEVAPKLEDAIFGAKKGQVVGPLPSGQGYVVFKVREHRASSAVGFEQAKERIREQLAQEAYVKAAQEFKQQLRARAHIDIRM